VTIAKFREDAGVMMPGIWCKGHDLEGRVIYDMNDVDPEQNEVGVERDDPNKVLTDRLLCRSTPHLIKLYHKTSHSRYCEKRPDSTNIYSKRNLNTL